MLDLMSPGPPSLVVIIILVLSGARGVHESARDTTCLDYSTPGLTPTATHTRHVSLYINIYAYNIHAHLRINICNLGILSAIFVFELRATQNGQLVLGISSVVHN